APARAGAFAVPARWQSSAESRDRRRRRGSGRPSLPHSTEPHRPSLLPGLPLTGEPYAGSRLFVLVSVPPPVAALFLFRLGAGGAFLLGPRALAARRRVGASATRRAGA